MAARGGKALTPPSLEDRSTPLSSWALWKLRNAGRFALLFTIILVVVDLGHEGPNYLMRYAPAARVEAALAIARESFHGGDRDAAAKAVGPVVDEAIWLADQDPKRAAFEAGAAFALAVRGGADAGDVARRVRLARAFVKPDDAKAESMVADAEAAAARYAAE